MSRTKHRAELLYRYLIIATKRLTDRQLMILLAIVVGLAAGLRLTCSSIRSSFSAFR